MLLHPWVSLILNVITKMASQELKCPQRLLPIFKGEHLEHMQTSYKEGGGWHSYPHAISTMKNPCISSGSYLYNGATSPNDKQTYGWLKISNSPTLEQFGSRVPPNLGCCNFFCSYGCWVATKLVNGLSIPFHSPTLPPNLPPSFKMNQLQT